jgi:hypothetical protein
VPSRCRPIWGQLGNTAQLTAWIVRMARPQIGHAVSPLRPSSDCLLLAIAHHVHGQAVVPHY